MNETDAELAEFKLKLQDAAARQWLTDSEQTPMLTPTEVVEYVYCPRFIWFMNVQQIPQHEETRFKVLKGREIHQRRTIENRNYLRRKIGATRRETEVYLASPKLRLRGIVDEVLWLKDGTLAPLDYKYTLPREALFKTHEMQIVLYAILIREVYQKPVMRGFVAYVRDGSQLTEMVINEQLVIKAKRLIDEIFSILKTGRLPVRTTSKLRCEDCCYRNICI